MSKIIGQLLLCWSVLITVVGCSEEQGDIRVNRILGGTNMTNKVPLDQLDLPFGLTEEGLSKVEVLYAFYSAKTGAGKQEITISGNGKVNLLFTQTRDAPPMTREGDLPLSVFVRLLEMMEEQGFIHFQDHYPPKHDPHARRVLRLVLPDRTKTVKLDEPGFPAFEVLAGAVKLATSLALPEALMHRFFPNL